MGKRFYIILDGNIPQQANIMASFHCANMGVVFHDTLTNNKHHFGCVWDPVLTTGINPTPDGTFRRYYYLGRMGGHHPTAFLFIRTGCILLRQRPTQAEGLLYWRKARQSDNTCTCILASARFSVLILGNNEVGRQIDKRLMDVALAP